MLCTVFTHSLFCIRNLTRSLRSLVRFLIRHNSCVNTVRAHFPWSILYLSYDPYGPARAFIAKLLRKSPYEGRTRWREQGRKKPSGPARIAYGPHTGIFSIVLQWKRARDANNNNFSVKMSDVSEHSEFCYPKKKKKKEKRGGHMIKCLLTELGRAGRENI